MVRNRIGRVLAATAVAGALVFGWSGAAQAATTPIHIIDEDKGKTVKTIDAKHDCEKAPQLQGYDKTKDLWYFVIPDGAGFKLDDVVFTFTGTDGNDFTVTVPTAELIFIPGEGDNGPLLTAAFQTSLGATLKDGVVSVENESPDLHFDFGIVNTCPGEAPSAAPAPTSAAASSSSARSLPVTGTAVGGLVATAVALIGGGVALVAMRRRRVKFDA